MAGLGLLFGTVLALAYRFLRVPEDPRLEVIIDMLPGNNCGACGQPGCSAFAETLLDGGNLPSGCTVSNPEKIDEIAGFLGVDAGEQVKRVARLHCAGGLAQAKQVAAYSGFESCRAAAVTSGGGKGCSWGCLGLADCVRVCTFDALHMNTNGLPTVTTQKCTACGDCVEACPKDLFELLPMDQPLLVQCSIPLGGEEARALCTVACDACERCARYARPGLIEMKNNLPVIDYVHYEGPECPEATFRCPTGAIQWVVEDQFEDSEPANRGGHVERL